MRATLVPGLKNRISYVVAADRTVPHLFPEAALRLDMPNVFATAYMVGLFEWVCTALAAEHLDDGEGSVGTHVDFSHVAATLPGMTVTAECELIEVSGRKLRFRVDGHDGVEAIGGGFHERHVIGRASFDARVAQKLGVAA